MPNTRDFKFGEHTFTVGTNTVRQENGRTSLNEARRRYLFGGEFDSELERKASFEALDPFYTDIVGALRAIDGNAKHQLLLDFMYEPVAWDNYFWDNYGDREELFKAAVWAQNENGWYPKPLVTDEDDLDAAEIMSNTLTAIDLDNTSDVDMPDAETIVAAVQDRANIAADNKGEDFLGSKTS